MTLEEEVEEDGGRGGRPCGSVGGGRSWDSVGRRLAGAATHHALSLPALVDGDDEAQPLHRPNNTATAAAVNPCSSSTATASSASSSSNSIPDGGSCNSNQPTTNCRFFKSSIL